MRLSSALKLAALAASLLAAAPFASAELRQGASGIEYVKRFQPSPAGTACIYKCPSIAGFVQIDALVTEAITTDTDPNGVVSTERETTCRYTNDASKTEVQCYYKDNGETRRRFPDVRCPSTADAPPANCRTIRARRVLSPLEEVVRSRQYSPRRRLTGQK